MKTKNKLPLSIIIIFITICSNIQGQISGIIYDGSDENPLPGAHIFLKEIDRIETSDENGKFTFLNVQEGKYKIQITYIGYDTLVENISVTKKHIEKKYRLNPKSYQIKETVITGTKVEVSRNINPYSISIISRKELQESEESAILPLISERIPGVFVSQRGVTGFGVAGGAAGKISIRGIGGDPNTRILMLIDGNPQYQGIFGHPLPDSYVTSDAEKVEVIRGPASLLYGSNAMGGVINIITRKQKHMGLSADAKISFGSFLTQKYMGSIGYRSKKFSVFASINHNETQGHRENSEFYINNGFIKTSYKINSNLKLNINGNIAKFKSYDPGPATNPDPSYSTQKHWVDILRGMASVSFENDFGASKGNLSLYYNFGEHDIYSGFHSYDNNLGIAAYESFQLGSKTNFTVGFDYTNVGGQADQPNKAGIQTEIIDKQTHSSGTYIFLQQGIGNKILASGGLRAELDPVYGTELIPQIGFSLQASDNTSIKSSVSKGFRSPTLKELYLFIPANPDLKPESMWNYEIGLIQQALNKKISFDFTTYYSQGKNLIQTVGQFPNVRNENTGSFKHYGVEIQLNYNLSKSFRISSNYSYLHMEKAITGAPVHKAFLSGAYHINRITFNANLTYVGDLYTSVSPNETTQSYTLLNARLSYNLNKYIKLFLSGENLTDQQYEINYDYPMPGITVMGGVHFTYRPNK
ncbi:TonB-dependent receptor [Bacteroidota bacterium]